MGDETYSIDNVATLEGPAKEVELPSGTKGMGQEVKNQDTKDEDLLEDRLGFMERFANEYMGTEPHYAGTMYKEIEDKIRDLAGKMNGEQFLEQLNARDGLQEENVGIDNLTTLPQLLAAHMVLQGVLEGDDKTFDDKLVARYQELGNLVVREKGPIAEASEADEKHKLNRNEKVGSALVIQEDRADEDERVGVKTHRRVITVRYDTSNTYTKSSKDFDVTETRRYKDPENHESTKARAISDLLDNPRKIVLSLNHGDLHALATRNEYDQPIARTVNSLDIDGIRLDDNTTEVSYERRAGKEHHPLARTPDHLVTVNQETFQIRKAANNWHDVGGRETADQLLTTIIIDGDRILVCQQTIENGSTKTDNKIKYNPHLQANKATLEARLVELKDCGDKEGLIDQIKQARKASEEALGELRRERPEFAYLEKPESVDLQIPDYEDTAYNEIPAELPSREQNPFVAVRLAREMGALG